MSKAHEPWCDHLNRGRTMWWDQGKLRGYICECERRHPRERRVFEPNWWERTDADR